MAGSRLQTLRVHYEQAGSGRNVLVLACVATSPRRLVETRTGLASREMARVRDRSARVRPDGVFVVLRRRKDG